MNTAAQVDGDAARALAEAGHEIASHGHKWIDYQHVPREVEAAHIAEAVATHAAICGARPLGFYQGRMSPNTRELVMADGGFLYDADSYADELPYWHPGSLEAGRPHLIVPYTLDANDMRFSTVAGYGQGEDFFLYLRDAFDQLWREGDERPRMLSVGLHARLDGRPARARALERFLDHVAAPDRVWVARRVDIARHWWRHHLPAGASIPEPLRAAVQAEESHA